MHRRHFLRSGLVAASAAVGFRTWAVPFAPPEKPPRHFIMIWLAGGASHMDLWDIKEGSVNQGEFKSIETAVAGIRISELLPNVAKEFKNLSVIRTLRSREADTARASYRMTHIWNPSELGVKYPGVGSVVAYHFGSPAAPVPRCITLDGDPGFGDPGALGPIYAGFPVHNPGTVPDLRNENADPKRTADRRDFLDILDSNFAEERVPHIKNEEERRKQGGTAQNLRELHQVAWEYAGRVDPKLFAFDRQDMDKLERFGQNGFGRSCLLATKLVQAGAAAVSVTLGGWDMHANFATSMPPRAAVLDSGFSGLMAALRETGLLHKTVVLCASPFGRSPRINQGGARIPWSNGWSVVLGGCGMGGVEYGRMDKDGMAIERDPVSVEQLYATIYTALGLDLKDPDLHLRDNLGRKFSIVGEHQGVQPIKELLKTVKG